MGCATERKINLETVAETLKLHKLLLMLWQSFLQEFQLHEQILDWFVGFNRANVESFYDVCASVRDCSDKLIQCQIVFFVNVANKFSDTWSVMRVLEVSAGDCTVHSFVLWRNRGGHHTHIAMPGARPYISGCSDIFGIFESLNRLIVILLSSDRNLIHQFLSAHDNSFRIQHLEHLHEFRAIHCAIRTQVVNNVVKHCLIEVFLFGGRWRLYTTEI